MKRCVRGAAWLLAAVWVAAAAAAAAAVVVAVAPACPLPPTPHPPPQPTTTQERIEQAGGMLLNNGGLRLMGMLATTRAIGDFDLQPYGLTPVPEVMRLPRTSEDEFLVRRRTRAGGGGVGMIWDGRWHHMLRVSGCDSGRELGSQHSLHLYPPSPSTSTPPTLINPHPPHPHNIPTPPPHPGAGIRWSVGQGGAGRGGGVCAQRVDARGRCARERQRLRHVRPQPLALAAHRLPSAPQHLGVGGRHPATTPAIIISSTTSSSSTITSSSSSTINSSSHTAAPLPRSTAIPGLSDSSGPRPHLLRLQGRARGGRRDDALCAQPPQPGRHHRGGGQPAAALPVRVQLDHHPGRGGLVHDAAAGGEQR